MKISPPVLYHLQLHQSLKKTVFNNNAMEETLFHKSGDLATYNVFNWILLPNHSFVSLKVGEVTLHSPANHSVTIHKKMALWSGMFLKVRHSSRTVCKMFLSFIILRLLYCSSPTKVRCNGKNMKP